MLSWLGVYLEYFECCSAWIRVYFCFGALFKFQLLLFHVVYPFSFSVMFSPLPYFAPKLFCFLCIQLLVYLLAFYTYLLVEYSGISPQLVVWGIHTVVFFFHFFFLLLLAAVLNFFVLFCVFLESLNCCHFIILNAGECSSYFFSCLYHLLDVKPCAYSYFSCLLVDLSSLVHYKTGPEYLTRRIDLVWWCLCPIFLSTYNFLFWKAFWYFTDLTVLFLSLFLFSFYHDQQNTFFNHKFHSYILVVYSYCLFQGGLFFLIFGKYLNTIHIHKMVYLFQIFCKFVASSAFPKYIIQWHHCCNK